jgi:hypothetical protein
MNHRYKACVGGAHALLLIFRSGLYLVTALGVEIGRETLGLIKSRQ